MCLPRIAVAAFGLCLLVMGQALNAQIPVTLRHYFCIPQEPCGAVSQVCWSPGHEWGASSCTYCTGTQKQDLCQRNNGGSCVTPGNQSCGARIAGTCNETDSWNHLGVCQGDAWMGPTCTVPKC